MHVRQLRGEFKQLQDVIETIPAYVWSALPDGSVDFINRRWLEFSGSPGAGDSAGVGSKPFTPMTVPTSSRLAHGPRFRERDGSGSARARGGWGVSLAVDPYVPLRDERGRSSSGTEKARTSTIASAPKKRFARVKPRLPRFCRLRHRCLLYGRIRRRERFIDVEPPRPVRNLGYTREEIIGRDQCFSSMRGEILSGSSEISVRGLEGQETRDFRDTPSQEGWNRVPCRDPRS